MNLWLNVLKAIGIGLGWYLLLFAGIWVMLTLRLGVLRLADIGLKDVSQGPSTLALAPFIVPFFLAFAALYLPPQGRLYAAIGALLLILAIWIWVGVQIYNMPLD